MSKNDLKNDNGQKKCCATCFFHWGTGVERYHTCINSLSRYGVEMTHEESVCEFWRKKHE